MTKTIELPDYREPDWGNAHYGSLEELKTLLLYKRIVKWDKDHLELEDGTKVTIYHNQNPIALAECEADDGNGGYYYSVGSLVIGKIHFPVVEA